MGVGSVVTFMGTDPLACIKLGDSGDGCRVGDSVPRGPLPLSTELFLPNRRSWLTIGPKNHDLS